MNNLKFKHNELFDLQRKLQKMNSVDLADYIKGLDESEQMISIKLLDKELLADTFSELPRKEKPKSLQILPTKKSRKSLKNWNQMNLLTLSKNYQPIWSTNY